MKGCSKGFVKIGAGKTKKIYPAGILKLSVPGDMMA